MQIETVGVIGTGDMGSAVGRTLTDEGHRVITDLSGRSQHSVDLARCAGIEDVKSLERVIEEADLLLSILPPTEAINFAERVAELIRLKSSSLVYADCNAVSPKTVLKIEQFFSALGIEFLDVGIVGAAPRKGNVATRFYVSGQQIGALEKLNNSKIRVINMGTEIGKASALKAAYAGLNKGTQALHATVLLAAERLGVRQMLMRELEESQQQAEVRMKQEVPYLAATAVRFAGEMKEIASTYESVGVTGKIHEGAAWLFEGLAETPLSSETRATLDRSRSLDEAIDIFTRFINKKS
ncbi:MAG: hypothetical protein CMM56_02605 [Rhodospirillaceae bacterium]|nr:hypothetical protein [Rhodospirillaceae bacterium]|tara:strand:- start:1778 stop:2668 length:891 start_codon:yes stop_codon:yes gene_type:complete